MANEVASTILEQLDGNKFIAMTGCNAFIADGDTLRMKIPRNGSRANRLWITLNRKDLYDMRFFRYVSPRFDRKHYLWHDSKETDEVCYNDVYFDQLQEIFTKHTGMYTHL